MEPLVAVVTSTLKDFETLIWDDLCIHPHGFRVVIVKRNTERFLSLLACQRINYSHLR
jgi:hypothetical protein